MVVGFYPAVLSCLGAGLGEQEENWFCQDCCQPGKHKKFFPGRKLTEERKGRELGEYKGIVMIIQGG